MKKTTVRLPRAAATAITVCVIAATAPATHGQQKPLTVDDAIALARPITNRDPTIHSVEIKGRTPILWVKYLYRAPDGYFGWMTIAEPKFTYFAAAGDRIVFYDPRRGELVDVTGSFPGIIFSLDRELSIGYAFYPSSDPPAGLSIDLPMILSRKTTDRRLEPLEGGKYRLVLVNQEAGNSLTATIDPSQSFPFTSIESNTFKVDVNSPETAAPPPIPTGRELRQWIAVKEIPLPASVPELTRLAMLEVFTVYAIAPRSLALQKGVESPERRQFESSLGEKVNWDTVESNVRRDIPKLQQALPLPW